MCCIALTCDTQLPSTSSLLSLLFFSLLLLSSSPSLHFPHSSSLSSLVSSLSLCLSDSRVVCSFSLSLSLSNNLPLSVSDPLCLTFLPSMTVSLSLVHARLSSVSSSAYSLFVFAVVDVVGRVARVAGVVVAMAVVVVWCVEVSESASPCARGKRTRVCSKTPACLKYADVFNAHASRSTHKTTHRTHFAAHTDQHTTTHTHTNMRSPHTPQTLINTHITITRSRNGPSMRVAWVMLNTSFRSDDSRVCGSFAVNFGTGRQSLLHASAVGCANSGSPAGLCSDLPCDVQVFSLPSRRWFACLTTIISSWCVVSVSANPWCVQRIGRRRVKWPRRRPRLRRVRVRRCLYRWVVWTREVVSGNTPSGGKDAQTTVRRPPP